MYSCCGTGGIKKHLLLKANKENYLSRRGEQNYEKENNRSIINNGNGSNNDGRMWKQVGFQDSRWRKELYNWYFPVCRARIFR